MSLREAVESDTTGPGANCPIGLLIRGEVPKGSARVEPLEADDREWLAEVMTVGVRWPTGTAVFRGLRDAGFQVGPTAVQAHRNQRCGCFSRLRGAA